MNVLAMSIRFFPQHQLFHQRLLLIGMLSLAAIVQAGEPLDDPIPEPIPLSNINVSLTGVASGLTAPTWGIFVPGAPANFLVVTDQPGFLWVIDLTSGAKFKLLDLSDQIVPLSIFDERGLLGVAFHPQFPINRLFYTYTSEQINGPADFSTMSVGTTANHQSVIREWQFPALTNREILRIDEPQSNHNGGAVEFDLDGNLLIAIGDGGGSDDMGTGHGESGNGQDPTNVLGTILRIDPLGTDSANGEYGIPSDNPFVASPTAVKEILAFGFRNPYRISVDRQTGVLIAADVGQGDIEEIDVVLSGRNYGWNLKEGSFFFDPNGNGPGFVTDEDPGVSPFLVDPIAEYDHDEGFAVIGGHIYRGNSIPALRGRYVFGDNNGRLFFLNDQFAIEELNVVGTDPIGSLLGFGLDATGEIYVLSNDFGLTIGTNGLVQRLVAAE